MVPGDKFQQAPLDKLVGSCPTCRIGLQAYAVPSQPASFEICPRCLGVWFDAGELRLLNEPGVTGWLKKLIDSLHTP